MADRHEDQPDQCRRENRTLQWNTSGWNYLGEDLASLIADEADIDHRSKTTSDVFT
jgi:hypothetical protein